VLTKPDTNVQCVKIIKFELFITFVTIIGSSMPLFGGYKTHYVVPSLCRTRTVQSDPCHVDTIAGDYFLGLCDQKSSYKHVSGFGR